MRPEGIISARKKHSLTCSRGRPFGNETRDIDGRNEAVGPPSALGETFASGLSFGEGISIEQSLAAAMWASSAERVLVGGLSSYG